MMLRSKWPGLTRAPMDLAPVDKAALRTFSLSTLIRMSSFLTSDGVTLDLLPSNRSMSETRSRQAEEVDDKVDEGCLYIGRKL
jgi:hypothetical protein